MTVTERITNYLSSGGLFNPEFMEHQKMSQLLQDCRYEIDYITKNRDLFRRLRLEAEGVAGVRAMKLKIATEALEDIAKCTDHKIPNARASHEALLAQVALAKIKAEQGAYSENNN